MLHFAAGRTQYGRALLWTSAFCGVLLVVSVPSCAERAPSREHQDPGVLVLTPTPEPVTLPTRRYRQVIDALAAYVALPPWHVGQAAFTGGEWWEAQIMVESGGKPEAVRYEAHHDRVADGDRPGLDDGIREDDKSFGLTQVLGSNIRRMVGVANGTPMDFSHALLPLTSLVYGLRMLTEELRAVQGDVPRALCRYNGGPSGTSMVPSRDGRGLEYRRQEYVDKVRIMAHRVVDDRLRWQTGADR